jgi:predicted RNase H-like HicB family nuclease
MRTRLEFCWHCPSSSARLRCYADGQNFHEKMKLTVEIEREDNGRWIAEVIDLPGLMAYGQSREDAVARVQALALHVLADRLEHRFIVDEGRC